MKSLGTNISNLVKSSVIKEFYVWINLEDLIVKHNYEIGFFTSSPRDNADNLMFVPNPNFKDGFISPFQDNLLRSYLAEYHLELRRKWSNDSYPSRLNAIFLFENEDDAYRYREYNPWHVANRILKKVKSKDKYVISKHDSSWVDFLRLPYSMDSETINNVCKSYWEGRKAKDCDLIHLGKSWSREPIFEVLYYGIVSFDKSYKAE